jgi:hypothetical protein
MRGGGIKCNAQQHTKKFCATKSTKDANKVGGCIVCRGGVKLKWENCVKCVAFKYFNHRGEPFTRVVAYFIDGSRHIDYLWSIK